MPNSKLYGTYISVKPIQASIDNIYKKHGDNAPIIKHIIGNDNEKPQYSLSYSYAKKLKNFFDKTVNNNQNKEEFEKHGGVDMKNFINSSLNNSRNQIYRLKKVKSNIGVPNQFIKPHEKSFLKPTNLDNLKPNKGMAKIELMEWVLKEDTEEKNETKKSSIAIILNPKKEILILKRSNIEGWMPEKYALVGGKQEEGEDNYDCVIREVLEETNLMLDNLIYCYSKIENNHDVSVFVGICKDPDDIELSKEHTDYKWVKGSEIDQYPIVPQLKEDIIKALEIVKDKISKGEENI